MKTSLLTLLAAFSLIPVLSHAQEEQVIYRNIFSCYGVDQDGNPANSMSPLVHWEEYRTAEGKSGSGYSVASVPGKPQDLENINSAAESAGAVNGYFHPGVPPKSWLLSIPSPDEVTAAGEIDPTKFSKVIFRWYGGVHIEGITQRLAVQIAGSNWYVSAKPFSNVIGWQPFAEKATQNAVEFTPAAAEWRELTFSPDAELQMGKAPEADLPAGLITNFGIFSENNTEEQNVGSMFDTFEVIGVKK